MRRFFLAATAFLLGMAAIAPTQADTRVYIGVGGGGWHHRPYYYAPYYGYAPYYAPPPVVYAPPPTVIYQMPPVTYSAPTVVDAVPASPAYTAPSGQTCREYQTRVQIGSGQQPAYGTACLQPDGSWKIVR